jgi:NAD(P)H-hydrate epimerase
MPPENALPRVVEDVPEFPTRPAAMHKGAAGKVAIIAGSRGMSGAAILAGLGALRGGAGLVRVYCPESVQPIIAASEPCLMTLPLPEDDAGRIAGGGVFAKLDLEWPTVVAVGPGVGLSPELGKLIADVLRAFSGPTVVDADGLNNLAALGPQAWVARAARPTVVTPHPGEMARLRQGAELPPLAGDDDETRLRIAHEYACLAQCVVVLKGHRTVVCTPAEAYINATGNPGMATGGMGDVLTGLLAALLAQGLSAFDAARLGVYAHGLAADFCQKEIAPVGYLAREVADLLPAALTHAARPRVGFRQSL